MPFQKLACIKTVRKISFFRLLSLVYFDDLPCLAQFSTLLLVLLHDLAACRS